MDEEVGILCRRETNAAFVEGKSPARGRNDKSTTLGDDGGG